MRGSRVHNLKNIDVDIPHNKLTVITGLSGSGKSSLAFDTIFAEGQRRYIETFSSYARNMLGSLERPDVDEIKGLSPVISIEQKTVNKNPRSTIGTITEVYDFLRLLFARIGEAVSYASGMKMVILMALITNLIIPLGFGLKAGVGLFLLALILLAVIIGTLESAIARLRMSHVFEFVFVMSSFALIVASLAAVKMYGI